MQIGSIRYITFKLETRIICLNCAKYKHFADASIDTIRIRLKEDSLNSFNFA